MNYFISRGFAAVLFSQFIFLKYLNLKPLPFQYIINLIDNCSMNRDFFFAADIYYKCNTCKHMFSSGINRSQQTDGTSFSPL